VADERESEADPVCVENASERQRLSGTSGSELDVDRWAAIEPEPFCQIFSSPKKAESPTESGRRP
jgi:hypothetical protein